MTSPLKQRVLETADSLFYEIDRIISESGIAKASFYRFFTSKDTLITEWIQMRDQKWRAWLEESVDMLAPAASDKPLAVFDALYSRFRNPAFRGCAFLNTIVELARTDHPASQAARNHKQAVSALIRGYLHDAGYIGADSLAIEMMQLIDGALMTAVREGKPDSALRAKRFATMLLAEQPITPPPR
jgi:AcrR family transcriptional regulator